MTGVAVFDRELRKPQYSEIATNGCGDRICGGSWTCTDHVTWNDRMIHVASARECICGVETEDRKFFIDLVNRNKDFNRTNMWADAVEAMQADENFFFVPVTEEEIKQAAEGALRLLQELDDGR